MLRDQIVTQGHLPRFWLVVGRLHSDQLHADFFETFDDDAHGTGGACEGTNHGIFRKTGQFLALFFDDLAEIFDFEGADLVLVGNA